MSEAVMVAVITGILAIVGSYAGNIAVAHKKGEEDAIRDAQRETRQQVRLENIESKLDEHNAYARKFGQIERDITAIQKDIEYLRKEKT